MTATRACSVSELEQDAALRVVIDDVAICVVKDGDGVIHAIGDTCTHGDISLADGFVEGDTVECWAHGSAFSLPPFELYTSRKCIFTRIAKEQYEYPVR